MITDNHHSTLNGRNSKMNGTVVVKELKNLAAKIQCLPKVKPNYPRLKSKSLPTRDLSHCAELELIFALRAYSNTEYVYASNHRIYLLSANVIQKGEQGVIRAETFYESCFGLKKALEEQWVVIVNVALVS